MRKISILLILTIVMGCFNVSFVNADTTNTVITMDVSENSKTNVISSSQYPDGFGMYAGKYVEFTITPKATGIYDVSLTYGAFSGAVLEVYLDGEMKLKKAVNTGGWSTPVTESLGEIEVRGGNTYTLKVMVGLEATDTALLKNVTLTKPEDEPTVAPTAEPTAAPTAAPTAEPTVAPTAEPTAAPTAAPTAEPTIEPPVVDDSVLIKKDVSENSKTNVAISSQYAEGYGMYAGKYVEFIVVPEESGEYDVSLTYGAFSGAVIEVYLDGILKQTKAVNTGGWNAHATESFCNLELEGGREYTIKVMVGAEATETIQFKTITLKKVGEYTPPKTFKKEAEDYNPGGKNVGYFDTTDGLDREWNIDRGDDVEVAESGGGIVVVMSPTEWLNYDVTINATGKYNIIINYATTVECNMTVYSDDVKVTEGTLQATEGWSKYKEIKLGAVYLEEGKHTLKFLLNSGEVNFDSYLCDYTGDELIIEKISCGDYEITNESTALSSTDHFVIEFSDDVNIDDVTIENINLSDNEKTVLYDLIVTKNKVTVILKESLKKNTDYLLKIKNIQDADEFFTLDETEIAFKTSEEGIPCDTIADMEKNILNRDIKVSGTILSSQNKPIAGRNVYLVTKNNNTVVASGISQTDGTFTLNYQIPENSKDNVFNFEVKTQYGLSSETFSVPYVTDETEKRILADFSASTSLEGDNGILSIVEKHGSLLGWTPKADLESIINPHNVYNALVGIDVQSVEELSQYYYTRIAVEKLTQEEDVEQIASIIYNEENCEILGLSFEKISYIENKKADFAKDVQAIIYKNDAEYVKTLNNLIDEWILLEYDKSNQTLGFKDISLNYGQSAEINLSFTPQATDVKEIVMYITLSDESLWNDAYFVESDSMTGVLSGSGKSRTLLLTPEKSDGAIKEPGKIKLMPKALGTYTLKAEGYIEYANNLPFALKSNILSKEISITVNSASNRVERPASGGSSSGGNSGGSNGSFGGVTGLQTPDSSEKQDNKYKFIDTDSVLWAENAIDYLLVKDIISKPEDKYFRPNDNITREEFVKMIVKALGIYDSSAVSEFDDVAKNAWYYPYVSSAKKADIVYGNTENQFGVSKNITREDMAVIIVRALEKTGFKNILAEGEVFADDKEISLYAKEAVYFAKQLEIINGVGGNMFAPKQSATRAQAAKMIYEMMKAVGK